MGAILVPVDFSSVTADIVQHAAQLAKALGHKLWLLHVASPDPDFVGFDVGPEPVRESIAGRFREEHRQIQALANDLKGQGLEVEALLVQGRTADRVHEHAEKLGVAFIVIGSHGRGALSTALLGSTSHDVLKGARCPVLVVPIRRG